MRRLAHLALFVGMMLALSLFLHLYVFFHLSFLFDMGHGVLFWILFSFATVSFIIGMMLEPRCNRTGFRIYYIGAAVWLGTLFYFLFTLIGFDIVRHIVPVDYDLAGYVVVTIVAAITLASVVNALFVRVRHIRIDAPQLSRTVTIAHLSDIHIGCVHGPEYLAKLVERCNAAGVDLVCITGDIADGPHPYSDDDFAPLGRLRAPVYFTVGNHDHYAGLDQIIEILHRLGVRVLRNEAITIGELQLIGIDDSEQRGHLSSVLHRLPVRPRPFSILLYHRPDELAAVAKEGVDLMLAGHTHSGQFLPFNIMTRMVWPRSKGLYYYRSLILYASSGAGTWGPPFRLGTSSEIALLELVGREPVLERTRQSKRELGRSSTPRTRIDRSRIGVE